MKKLNVITIGALSLMGYLVISGYKEGPGFFGGWDCTGAETGLSNPTGCSAGSGCHSSSPTANILVTLELDSVGKPVTSYVGGMNYTVKITGTNNTASNLPKFGFQIGSIKGSTPQITPTNEGTWASPFPANVRYAAPQPGNFVVGVVEHDNYLAPTTGTGSTGTTYVEVVNWTAPVKGTGTVSFWGALNAVNDNGNADAGDLWNVQHMVITEETPNGVNNLTSGENVVRVYPNPFSMQATFSLTNEVQNASLSLYDISGKEVKQFTFSGKEVTLSRDNLMSGIYFYRITENQGMITGKVIIQ